MSAIGEEPVPPPPLPVGAAGDDAAMAVDDADGEATGSSSTSTAAARDADPAEAAAVNTERGVKRALDNPDDAQTEETDTDHAPRHPDDVLRGTKYREIRQIIGLMEPDCALLLAGDRGAFDRMRARMSPPCIIT